MFHRLEFFKMDNCDPLEDKVETWHVSIHLLIYTTTGFRKSNFCFYQNKIFCLTENYFTAYQMVLFFPLEHFSSKGESEFSGNTQMGPFFRGNAQVGP